uniref:Thiamin pyrophosphokinase 2 n=1 Tax=Haplochromis burtoni TaxID=8153 RepID=A0A3Q2VQH3_HAPBU
MASCCWAENILQLLRKMNNFYLPGSCRSSCFRFEIEGAQVGWIPPHVASLLARYPDVFSPPHQGAVTLCHGLDSYEKRSEAVSHVLQALRKEPSLTCLKGWRDEKYSVMPRFSDCPLMWMERTATSLFGVKRYGVHINGYTVSDSQEVCMWLARRSHTKQTYPGLLDNMAAGGLAAGVGIKHTLVKECQEEACVPAAIAKKARPVTLFTEALEQCGFPLCLMFPLLFLSHLKVADMFSTFLMLAACKDIRRACSVCVLSLLCFDDYVTFKAKNVFAHKHTFRFDSAPVISIPEVTKQ